MAITQEELLKAISDSQQKEAAIIKAEQVRLEDESKKILAELVTTKNATKESVDKVNTELNEMTKKYAQLEEEKRKSEERVANLEMIVGKIGSNGEDKESKHMSMNSILPIVLKNANIKEYANEKELREKYLRSNVFDEGQAAMSIANPVIEKELLNIADILNYASVTTANTKMLPVLVRMNERAFQTPGELGVVTADSSKLFRKQHNLIAERVQISIPVTLEILDLQTIPGVNVENDLQTDAAMALAQQTGEWLTTGTGLDQPIGIMNDSSVATSAEVTSLATFDFDSIAKMMDEIKKPYRTNAAFMMNSKALTTLRCKTNGIQSPLFEQDYKLSTPISLYGKSIIINDEMDDVLTGGKQPIIFGNFRYFKVLKYSNVIVDVNKSSINSGYYEFIYRTYIGSKVTDGNAFVKGVIA